MGSAGIAKITIANRQDFLACAFIWRVATATWGTLAPVRPVRQAPLLNLDIDQLLSTSAVKSTGLPRITGHIYILSHFHVPYPVGDQGATQSRQSASQRPADREPTGWGAVNPSSTEASIRPSHQRGAGACPDRQRGHPSRSSTGHPSVQVVNGDTPPVQVVKGTPSRPSGCRCHASSPQRRPSRALVPGWPNRLPAFSERRKPNDDTP